MAFPVSRIADNPPPATVLPGGIRIEATLPIFNAFFRWHSIGLHTFTALIFVGSTLLVWVFGFTFWTFLEAMVRAFNGRHGHSLLLPLFALMTRQRGALGMVDGWPMDASVVLALLATWCCLYLAFDHLLLWGNRGMQKHLAIRKPVGSQTPSFFVDLRHTEKGSPIAPDHGYLMLQPDQLRFGGQFQVITIPRHALTDMVVLRPSFGNLAATYVYLPLAGTDSVLQLMARDTATRLSDTRRDGERLEAALRDWLLGVPVTGEKQ